MKTVVIWDTCGAETIHFFILDGDLSRLNGLYINTYTEKTPEGRKKEKLLNELSKLTYDKKGNFLQKLLPAFPVDEVKAGALVIVAGFLP
jgi:hypothetical protein